MWKNRIASAVSLCALAALAACGNDVKSVTQPASLSHADFTSMTDALSAIIGTSTGAPSRAPAGSSSRARSADVNVDVSASCPVGGTIVFVGIVSASSSASHFAVSADLRDCAARGNDGTKWIFSTSQPVTITVDVARGSQNTLATGAEVGTIDWTNGTRSGRCPIDVTSSTLYTSSNNSYDVLLNGVVCGIPVDKHTVVVVS